MTVTGISSAKRSVVNFDHMYSRDELITAVAELDFLIVLTPYSAETRKIINSSVFAAMKQSAFFINLARGGVVDDDALIHALKAGQIAGAALDVFNQEPLPKNHPFWSIKNIIVTPHLAGFHDNYASEALPTVETNMHKFLAEDFSNMVNVVKRGQPGT